MITQISWSLAEKGFRTINRTFTFEASQGIKAFNCRFRDAKMEKTASVTLSPSALFLGFDFLNDLNTLCGVNIYDSPHFQLMSSIDQKEDIQNADYVVRIQNGTLDSRRPLYISKKRLDSLYSTFERRRSEICDDACDPINIYQVGDKYYIYDGKHRAALSAYLNKAVKCSVISTSVFADTHYTDFWKMMTRKREKYLRNITLYDLMLAGER